MTDRREYGKRAAVFVAIVVVIVVAAAAAPALVGPDRRVAAGPEHEEWDPAALAPERLESGGVADPNAGGLGTVVFDGTHQNRFEEEDVSALTDAITRAGGDVELTDPGEPMESVLSRADVLVVIDPGVPYQPEEVDAIEAFVRNGGRLVVFAEPNRQVVQISGFAAVVATDRSRLTALGSAFGIGFGTEYLYDMQTNDGNFKDVVVGPAGDAGGLTGGVEQVALYTAAPVTINRGTVFLRTAPTAAVDDDSRPDGYPVGVRSRNGRVLAFGDASFLGDDVSSVGDNDVLIARIVEFMAGG